MLLDKSKFTHDAYIFKSEGVRRGRRLGFFVNEGLARIKPDGSIFVYLHSTPIGGFDGRIRCCKFGTSPPAEFDPPPHRPGEEGDSDEGGED
jgi:hypothetical protein